MIVQGEAAVVPELKELWLRCFADTAEDVEYFFDYRYQSCECLVDMEEGRAAAMAFLLPASVTGTNREASYLYAFATHPDRQGRGIATRLLRAVCERNRAQNRLTVLSPADDGLAAFYEKRGFTKRYFAGLREGAFCAENSGAFGKMLCEKAEGALAGRNAGLRVLPCSAERYAGVRSRLLKPGDIFWDNDAVRYAAEENRHCGGACLSFFFPDGAEAAALVRREGETLCLRELLVREADADRPEGKDYAEAAARAAAEYWSGRMPGGEPLCKWRAYVPEAADGKAVLTGMADEAGACAYLNLLLD